MLHYLPYPSPSPALSTFTFPYPLNTLSKPRASVTFLRIVFFYIIRQWFILCLTRCQNKDCN